MIKVLPVRGGAGEVIRVWRWDGGEVVGLRRSQSDRGQRPASWILLVDRNDVYIGGRRIVRARNHQCNGAGYCPLPRPPNMVQNRH
jgi:hypothetical protein